MQSEIRIIFEIKYWIGGWKKAYPEEVIQNIDEFEKYFSKKLIKEINYGFEMRYNIIFGNDRYGHEYFDDGSYLLSKLVKMILYHELMISPYYIISFVEDHDYELYEKLDNKFFYNYYDNPPLQINWFATPLVYGELKKIKPDARLELDEKILFEKLIGIIEKWYSTLEKYIKGKKLFNDISYDYNHWLIYRKYINKEISKEDAYEYITKYLTGIND